MTWGAICFRKKVKFWYRLLHGHAEMAWWHRLCSGDCIDQFVWKLVDICRSPANGAPHISKVQVCVRRCGRCSEMSDCSANSNFGEQPAHGHPMCNLRGGAMTRAGWRSRHLWCSLSLNPLPYSSRPWLGPTGPDINCHHCPYNDDRELYLPGSGPAHDCPKAPEKDPSGKPTTLTLI